jgi:hypothetical protein
MRRDLAEERQQELVVARAQSQEPSAVSTPAPSTPHAAMLKLQRSAGNAAVGRLIAGAVTFAGAPAPPMPAPALSIQRCPGCGGTCGCEEDEEKSLQLSQLLGGAGRGEREGADHSDADEAVSPRSPARIAARIESARGGGAPLDQRVRGRLEHGLGTDLSGVRVHTDGEADSLARDLGARAFTTGREIFFRRGEHDTSSPSAMRTIAHEAAHVVQQARGPVDGKSFGSLRISEPGDSFEREADAAAERILDRRGAEGPRPPPAVERSGSVQRACSCGGTCGSCEREDEEEELRLQRLAEPAAGLTIQLLRDPLGNGLVVDWLPLAKLDFTRPDGTNGSQSAPFGDSDTATIPDVPRDITGDLTFPVAANWHPGSSPGPGPNPAPKCDACAAIQRAATQSVASFVASVLDQLPFPASLAAKILLSPAIAALSGLVGQAVNILPKELVQKCRELSIDDAIQQVAAMKTLADLQDCHAIPGEDFCKISDAINRGVSSVKIPIVTRLLLLIIGSIREKVFKVLSDALAVVLKELLQARKACGLSGPPAPVVAGKGQATSTMRVHVLVGPDGAMQVQGPGPQVTSSGTGATLVVPVDSSKSGSAAGALVAQVPMIKSTGADNSLVSRQFTVNVNMAAPPQARKIDCPVEKFGAFKVASDRFEHEDDEETHIHHWFFGLEPRVRDVLHTGQAILKITGRASRTGSVDFNLKLGEKRAKRVEKILQDFAGSDSHPRTFSLGLLGTEEAGEVAEERRVDVEIEGEIPAEQVAKVKEPLCTGHLGEKADEGPPVPITQPDEIPITGALEPALVGAGVNGSGPETAPELGGPGEAFEAAGAAPPQLEVAEPSADGALAGTLAEAEQAPTVGEGFAGGFGQGLEELLGAGAAVEQAPTLGEGFAGGFGQGLEELLGAGPAAPEPELVGAGVGGEQEEDSL